MTPIPILDLTAEVRQLDPELNAAIQNVLHTTQFIMGPDVKAFEREVAAFLGAKHAFGVNSGTDALVIGLRAMGIGEGDEVITTPFTFFATAESISAVGAKPVFVDVEPDSFNINPALVAEKINPRTKAILPVHLFGRPANMSALMALAEKHGLFVLEDCAQSFGATDQGKPTGTIGTVGAYSFFPTKNLGCYGDGGLITTDDDALAETMGMLRVHGAKKKYHNEILGYNSRLDTLQAAILRVKLPHLADWNAARRAVATRYNEALEDVSGLITPEITDGHVFHQYTIRIVEKKRDAVQQALRERGVGTMVYYPIPQDQLPIYRGQYPPNPVSDLLARQVLSLPMWPQMPEDVQSRVIEAVRDVLRCGA